MSTARKPSRSSIVIHTKPKPARPLHDDVATQAVKSLVDMSWDASAEMLTNLRDLSYLQAHSLANFKDTLYKAATDAARCRDIQGLLRVNVDFGSAAVVEAVTFARELFNRMIAAQRVMVCPAALSGATSSSPDRSADRVPDSERNFILEHLEKEVERQAAASRLAKPA